MQIQDVTLHTRSLAPLRDFYAATLGFPLLAETDQRLTFEAGTTRLTFVEEPAFDSFYHLAFDIPGNQVEEAQAWLERRVPLLADEHGRNRFPPGERWNTTNLYFDDPAGNILEFIARHNLNHEAEAFAGVLHVSELGVVVPDVSAAVQDFGERFDLRPFNGESDTFTAIGGHDGMLIVVREGRGWFPVGRPAVAAPFEVGFDGSTISSKSRMA